MEVLSYLMIETFQHLSYIKKNGMECSSVAEYAYTVF